MRHQAHIISDQPIEAEVRVGQHALAPYGPLPRSWLEQGWVARLSEAQLRVAVVLLSHADARGQCFPGIPTLMRISGLSHGAVHSNLNQLEAFGLVERRRAPGRPTLYRLLQARRPAPPKTARPIRQVMDRSSSVRTGPAVGGPVRGFARPAASGAGPVQQFKDGNTIVNKQEHTAAGQLTTAEGEAGPDGSRREGHTTSISPAGDPAVVFVQSLSQDEQQQAKKRVLQREPDVATLLEKYPPHSPSIAIRIYNLYHPPKPCDGFNGPGKGSAG